LERRDSRESGGEKVLVGLCRGGESGGSGYAMFRVQRLWKGGGWLRLCVRKYVCGVERRRSKMSKIITFISPKHGCVATGRRAMACPSPIPRGAW
jgi:hypothetical protein